MGWGFYGVGGPGRRSPGLILVHTRTIRAPYLILSRQECAFGRFEGTPRPSARAAPPGRLPFGPCRGPTNDATVTTPVLPMPRKTRLPVQRLGPDEPAR